MAAKRVDPAKAKAAKQKKIAIVGALLLVAVLAVQGPKTLKLLKGPQPAATASAAGGPAKGGPAEGGPAASPTGGPAVAPTTAPGGIAAGEAPSAGAAELASVPDSDQAPVVDDGQLATFERFSSKDPFAQQAEAVLTPKPAPKDPAKTDPGSDPTKDSDPAKGGTTAGSTDGGFTAGDAGPPAAPALAAATSVAINGTAEDVELETPFPAAEPTFVLVSVAADGKSVQIGIAGGSYASGGETLKLTFGKKVTLQNTADGSRFELELLAVKGFPLPKRK